MDKEIWKDIEGYEGYYQISNMGNVKSLKRNIYNKDGLFQRVKKENIKVPIKTPDGYYSIKLCKDGKNKTITIHQLVANAFVNKPRTNDKLEVNHKDTNRINNKASNLEWVTHIENIKYSSELGHYKGRNGEKNPNYNNHKLHDFYKNNPDKAIELLSRKGSQNGRSVAIDMYDINGNLIKSFGFIRECANWLKDKLDLKVQVATIHQYILKHEKSNTDFYGYKFKIK